MAPDHYAQCPVRNSTNWPAPGPRYCLCYLIAKVDRDLRAQIAADIAAALIPNARNTNPGAEYLNDGLILAARIARGES